MKQTISIPRQSTGNFNNSASLANLKSKLYRLSTHSVEWFTVDVIRVITSDLVADKKST